MTKEQQLSPEEQKAIAYVLGVIGVILIIAVAIIFMARTVFWFSIVFFLISILYLMIGIIRDIYLVKESEEFDFVIPHFVVAFLLMLLFWGGAHFSFPIGYSKLSYQILEFNEDYAEMMGLPLQVTLEALNQTCEATPEFESCQSLVRTYELGSKAIGISDTAKTITTLFHLRY